MDDKAPRFWGDVQSLAQSQDFKVTIQASFQFLNLFAYNLSFMLYLENWGKRRSPRGKEERSQTITGSKTDMQIC